MRSLELERLRALELCLLVPAAEDGFERAFFVSRRAGRRRADAARPAAPAALELEAGLAAVAKRRWGRASSAPEDADELLLIGTFLRRPPPELRVVPLAALRARGRSLPPSALAVRRWRRISTPARSTATFGDRLAEAVERKRSQLVVGLDPRLELLPVELRGEAVLGRAEAATAYARFCCGLVDAVAPYVVAVKPQRRSSRCSGRTASRALERVCAYARAAGLLVIADGKRGDIGSTARAYAAAYLEPRDGEPALADAADGQHLPRRRLRRAVPAGVPAARRGHLLPRASTSNPGAGDIQD